MKDSRFPILNRFRRNDSGQSMVVIAVTLGAVMALAATGIEVGHVFYAYRILQASTQTATLAAAQAMPYIGASSSAVGSAQYNLVEYSSESGMKNASNMLSNASISATYVCSSTVAGSGLNVACQTPEPPAGSSASSGTCSGSATKCNEVNVTQTASVNLWLGRLVGLSTFNLAATASAAMRGGTATPYNIAVIIDTTASMNTCQLTAQGKNPCTADCPGGASTEVGCAVQGLEYLLEQMYPCDTNTTCTTNTAYVDSVALYVFPAVAAGDDKYDTSTTYCSSLLSGLLNATVPYTFPNVNTSTSVQNLLMPNTLGSYQVVDFDETYKTSDSTTNLNTGDTLGLPNAVGYGGTCPGLQAPGGQGTYYAQAIYAAQAALHAQQLSVSGSQNVMIIMSDGSANAENNSANTAYGGQTGKNQIVATTGTLNGTGSNTSYTYPSALGQCWQAVQAAQAATAAGTMVYTVAMGAEIGTPQASSDASCVTDVSKLSETALSNGAVTWPTGGSYPGTACNAIGAMASNANTFYSDDTDNCSATNNSGFTTMSSIFTKISNGFTAARLVPNNL
jgi:hypothetical protein